MQIFYNPVWEGTRPVIRKYDGTENLLRISYSSFNDYMFFPKTPEMQRKSKHLDQVRLPSSLDASKFEQLSEASHFVQFFPKNDNKNKSGKCQLNKIRFPKFRESLESKWFLLEESRLGVWVNSFIVKSLMKPNIKRLSLQSKNLSYW